MDTNPKQRIVEKIKKSTNILVTVSRGPSVDELAAALAFTLILNKMDKHATAVFSGATPPAITFLEPQKTFEKTTSSLRDFIIALDKEKADRLRYKVEDDVVRIYITPYQTTITERDLNFSQGDFNVELIVALGVKKQGDLDEAISAHGRILHDATIVTINTEDSGSSLGSIEWSDNKASSLCEMLMSLSEALQSNVIDEQIATSLLTGIVAATDRFSNPKTSPRVMTMSAQLMAAGANQQLIADELERSNEESQANDSKSIKINKTSTGETPKTSASDNSPQDDQSEVPAADEPANERVKPQSNDGSLLINHDEEVAEAKSALDQALSGLGSLPPAMPSLSVADLQKEIAAENKALDEAATHEMEDGNKPPVEAEQSQPESTPQPPVEQSTPPAAPQPPVPAAPPPAATPTQVADWRTTGAVHEPIMGGTLSATAAEAAAERAREEARNRNRTLLSHDSPYQSVPGSQDVNAAPMSEPAITDPLSSYDHVGNDRSLTRGKPLQPVTMQPISSNPSSFNQGFVPPADNQSTHVPTIAELEEQAHRSAEPADAKASSLESARNEIGNLFDAGGYELTPSPDSATPLAATPPNPMTQPAFNPAPQDSQPGSVAPPPLPPLPPLPDFSTLPPLPNDNQVPQSPHPGAEPFTQQQTAPQEPAPNQFRIPGQ